MAAVLKIQYDAIYAYGQMETGFYIQYIPKKFPKM